MSSLEIISYALQYPNGKLAGIDLASGGYPYPVEGIANVWTAKPETLQKYLQTGIEGLKIVKLTITAEPLTSSGV